MAEIEQIKPIYGELIGYLSQAPNPEKVSVTRQSQIWEQYHSTIDELNEISEKDYNRFKIDIVNQSDSSYIDISVYRNKLSGLISRLHGEYFSNEPAPFSGMPTTVVSQIQEQSQSLQVQMLLEVQSKIDEKLSNLDKSKIKEKGFLEKVKISLSSVRSVAQLIWLLLSTAKDCGLSLDELKELFM
jgi:hypothetical protein